MKNFNIFALEGDPHTSDMDVCETLGLDMELAGKPEINDAAIAAMHKQNVAHFMKNGMSATEAAAQADALAKKAYDRVEAAQQRP